MDFEIPKSELKITKEFLISKNSEETYMSTYLGVPVKKGLLISPLRNDRKPTASFYRNKKGELIFHDFGIGFHGNFISVVMFLNNCSYPKALKIIAEDFNLIERTTNKDPIKIKYATEFINEKTTTLIQIEEQPFQLNELKWWNSFGISENTLHKFHCHSCKNVFLNGNYYKSSSQRNMMFGYYGGKKDGIELWRIYFPNLKTYRFLSNWSSSIIQGIKQLPKTSDFIIIEKSLKDVMCLYECGISAIAPCGETIILNKSQMDRLYNITKNIIVMYDNDLAGVKNAHKYKNLYPNIKVVFIKRKYAKDISDLYKSLNKKEFNRVIDEIYEIKENQNIRETEHFWIF